MKKRKKCFVLLVAAALVLPLAQGDMAEAKKEAKKKKENEKVTSVEFTNVQKELRLQKGKKYRLKTSVKVKPDKGKYKKLKFTSSNRKVVLVNSSGLLKGKRTGTAKIKAVSRTDSRKKAIISVSVTKDVLVKSIQLNRSMITVDEFDEEDIQLEVKRILPSNAKNKEVEWSTSNEDVADVDDEGVVITGDVGTAVITAAAADGGGAVATCKVVVKENQDKDDEEKQTQQPVDNNPPAPQTPAPQTQTPQTEAPQTPAPSPVVGVPVTDFMIAVTADWLAPGDISRLNISYAPSDTTQQGVVWTTSDEAVTVDDSGRLKIKDNFSFGEEDTERQIVVTATSEYNPEIAKSVVLTVYNPDKTDTPKLENPRLALTESQAPAWALGGVYGILSFTGEGTAIFNSRNHFTSVRNNGCAWYLDSKRRRTDISDYKYLALTLEADYSQLQEIKLMTWTGSDDSEFYWDKKDNWGYGLLGKIQNEDGTYTLIYRVDHVFQNTKNAKSIGIGIKSWDRGEEETDDHFVAREVGIKRIEFINLLPVGCEITGEEDEVPKELSSPKVNIGKENVVSWVHTGEFGTTAFGEDGTVSFNSQPADGIHAGDALNNGCAWYLDSSKNMVDVSGYNYVYIKVKSDAVVDLMSWSASSHPDSYYNKKVIYGPGTEIENGDGTKTLVYRVSTVFTNMQKVRAIGFLVESGTMDEYQAGDFAPRSAEIYEIGFSDQMPESE